MSGTPDRFPSGSELTNAIVNGILRVLPEVLVAGPNMDIRKHGRKVVFNPKKQQQRGVGGGGGLVAYKVSKMYGDFLECHSWNPVDEIEGGDAINVALPYRLQFTPFDNKTVTFTDGTVEIDYVYSDAKTAAKFERLRTAENPDAVLETQVIIPEYYEGDVIFAANVVSGTYDNEDPAVLITLMDVNVAARLWARHEN